MAEPIFPDGVTGLLALAMVVERGDEEITAALESASGIVDAWILAGGAGEFSSAHLLTVRGVAAHDQPHYHIVFARVDADDEDDASAPWNVVLAQNIASFTLLLRYDEVLDENSEKNAIRAWCETHRESAMSCGYVEVRDAVTGKVGLEPRIVRSGIGVPGVSPGGTGWRFEGRALPQLVPPVPSFSGLTVNRMAERVPGVVIVRTPVSRSRSELVRDIARLRVDLDEQRNEPSGHYPQPRTLLLLAEQLEIVAMMGTGEDESDLLEEAEQLFEERLRTPSRTPEDYLALMGAAGYFERRGNTSRAGALYNAAALRFPNRAEPFLRLARLDLMQGAYASALLNAQRGLNLPLPDLNSGYAIEPSAYQWELAEIAGDAATQCGGKLHVAEAAYLRALEEAPEGVERITLKRKLASVRDARFGQGE